MYIKYQKIHIYKRISSSQTFIYTLNYVMLSVDDIDIQRVERWSLVASLGKWTFFDSIV